MKKGVRGVRAPERRARDDLGRIGDFMAAAGTLRPSGPALQLLHDRRSQAARWPGTVHRERLSYFPEPQGQSARPKRRNAWIADLMGGMTSDRNIAEGQSLVLFPAIKISRQAPVCASAECQ